jgi:hypothetical protein
VTEKTYEKPQSGKLVSRAYFKLGLLAYWRVYDMSHRTTKHKFKVILFVNVFPSRIRFSIKLTD